MFFRATVISLLGCLLLLHVEGQVRLAVLAAPDHAHEHTVEPPPPTELRPQPIVVVAPEPDRATLVVDIRRADLDRLLPDRDLARCARIVPAIRSGVPDGFKVYAIQPGSALATLGLQNGDTIQRVNDVPMDSIERALALYDERGHTDHIDLDIRRRGEPVRIVVLVHEVPPS